MSKIRANTVLPAHREKFAMTTADGLRLRGEVALPDWCDPVATLVCVHPLTTEGGSMESHLYRKISWRLPALTGLAVVRFNLRGAGDGPDISEGEFDFCEGEGLDLGAALAWVAQRELPEPWLVGWSFGTDVIIKYGDRDPVEGAVLLSPPVRFAEDSDLRRWADSGRRMVVVVPEFDDYLRPDAAEERFAGVPQAELVPVAGAGHLWVGERAVQAVLDEIARVVTPAAYPLPTDWDGPVERWSDL